MKNILLLSGSSRPNSAGEKLVPIIKESVESHPDFSVDYVDVRQLDLPFFDQNVSPSSEDFIPQHDSAKNWLEKLSKCDGVILLSPEYNGSLSAIQKNAMDWAYKEWFEKPVSLIGYGWSGAKRAQDNARVVLSNVKAIVMPVTANLSFTKQLAPDGTILDAEACKKNIDSAVEELINNI